MRRITAMLIMLAVGGGVALTQPQTKPAEQAEREIDPQHVDVADGYRIEAVVANLTVPTTAIFDGADLLIAESGFNNAGRARVLRVRLDGTTEEVASSGLTPPVTGLALRDGRSFVSHAGKVSVVEGGNLRDIVTDLRHGDHSNNKIVFGPDGKLYMGQGTV